MSTCTSAPSAFAAVSALWVASLRTLLSCSAMRSVVMSGRSSNHTHLVLELVDELAHRFHLDSGFASRRLRGLEHFEAWRKIDAKDIGRFLVDRLLFRFHDFEQARIARLIEAQIGCHDCRRFEPHRLHPPVDLAVNQNAVPFAPHL